MNIHYIFVNDGDNIGEMDVQVQWLVFRPRSRMVSTWKTILEGKENEQVKWITVDLFTITGLFEVFRNACARCTSHDAADDLRGVLGHQMQSSWLGWRSKITIRTTMEDAEMSARYHGSRTVPVSCLCYPFWVFNCVSWNMNIF